MSALENLKKNLGVAPTNQPLKNDLNSRGTSQPVIATPQTGSALGNLRANLNSPTPVTPVAKAPEKAGLYSSYADQVERKAMSFNAGFVASVGQLARSFQWLGDRIVGDRLTQNASDKALQAELKSSDDMLKLYRQKRDAGDSVGASRILDKLKVMSGNTIPYEAYADTKDSVFYKAQDKTQAWADVLKKSANITPENSKFSDRLFEGAGSSATYFIPALGVFKGASVLAKVSPRIAMLFAGSAGASLEAMAEAGSTFDEVKKTQGLQKAGEQSTKVFLANAILLAVSNNLGIFNPAKLGILKRALLSAPTEGLQEAIQQAIQNEASGRPIWEGVLESGAIGAIVGSVMGGGVDFVSTQTVEKNEGGKKGSVPVEAEPVSPALQALRENLDITPAIEAQKALEGTSAPLPSPIATEVQNQGVEAVPVGQGTGLEADVRLPVSPEIKISAEQKLKADKDWNDNFAGRVQELESQLTELRTQINEANENEKVALTKEKQSIETKLDEIEQEFLNKWRTVENENTPENIVEYVDGLDRSVETSFVREKDRGILQNTKEKILSEKSYNLKKVSIEDLIENDKDLLEYIDANEQRYEEGQYPENIVLNLENPIVVGSNGEVYDGYNRILTKMNNGETEIEAYVAVEKTVEKKKTSKPETSEEATERYWNEVIQPRIENEEAVIIGADDLKDYFGNDYDIKRHPIYSKSANDLFERAVKTLPEKIVKFVAGGTGSGKSDFIVPDIAEDFAGVVYDSTAWNKEGFLKQMAFVTENGKTSEVYGIVPDLARSRAYTFLREEAGKHPVTEQAFINTHTGSIQTMLKVIEEGGDVYILDTRNLTSKEQIEEAEYTHNPVAILNEVSYSKDYVKQQIKDIDLKTAKEIVEDRQEGTRSVSEKNRADQELTLEAQPTATAEESRTQTEVAGEKVNRFTGQKQEEKNPRVIGQQKPLVTKADLKTILQTNTEFKANPILTVEETSQGKVLSWSSKKTRFSIKATALGLVEKNLQVGDQIRVSPETFKGTGQELRVMKAGSKYASVGEFRDSSKKYSKTYNINDPTDFANIVRMFNEETANKMKQGIFEYGRAKTKAEVEERVSANFVDEPYTAEKLKEKKYNGTRTFYHGTIPENVEKITDEGFKIGSSLPEDAFRSGGYGQMQDSVSLSSDPKTASIFTGSSSIGAVIKTEVSPDAKIIEVTNIEYAEDLNDYVPDLKKRKVDAVWIGGGEKELVVINPKIIRVVGSRTFKVAGDKSELDSFMSDQPLSASKNASVGRYRDDTAMFLGNPDAIKPIQFPELVGLAKELSGNVPFLRKYQKSNGMFYGKGNGEIGLNPSLFEKENLKQLEATLAHEIGHLIDYLPDQTMARGNLMGRLATLRGFRKDFFSGVGATRTDSELRTQMYELSKYWRPYEEANATPSFIAYRKSAPEIYADFISALFNDPRTVSSMAPTAYNIFFEQLDRKPNVKQAYFELQDLLRNGDIVAKRRSATTEMFKVTEQESRERQIQNEIEQEMKEKSIWFKYKTQFVDINEVIKEKVKEAEKTGGKINPDDNPTYYLEERNYIGGKIKSEVETKYNTIYQELQKDGMTWEDLGELMFYERVLKGDRQEIANPLGYQPDFVQELMEVYEDVGSVKPDKEIHEKGTSDMKSVLGEDKFRKLQSLAVEYRENLKGFFEQGREEGIYSAELAQLFEDNAFYVPFKGAKYSGVTRTTFGVKAQKGTLGNIENPANTGIEKSVSIIRAIERNKVTRKTIEFLQERFPDEVIVAPTDQNGYPLNPPKDSDLDLVTYMQDGKVKGFHVDKYIADSIKKNTVAEQNLLISSLRFWNSGLFRPLFITFNLGFQSFNAIRDFKRFWKNVPNMTILKALNLYAKSARASKIRAFGLPKNPSALDLEAHALITRLENEQLLSITYNDIIKGESIEDAQIDRILRETGVRPTQETKLGALGERVGVNKKTPIIKQAFQILDFIESTGNLIETMPKIAGVYALEGKMEPREMRSFIRRYVGSPDFLAGGKFKPYMNEVFLFSNAIFQGIRSDYEIATQPKSRGAYWLKTAQAELLPKMLMLMATAGLFGDFLKELFAKVSSYDMTNYTIIPLGIDENGKAIYFRFPSDETGRLIGGAFWKVAMSMSDPEKLAELETYTDLLAYAGGQVPTLSPVVELGAFTLPTFLAGNNPYDFFRGRQVLTDDQQTAGGMERLKPFLSYMFQQMGGSVFMKLYNNETVPKDPSLSEKIVNLPVASNIAGRFIKVSNYGEVEKVREVSNEVRSEKAREGIENRRVVFDYVEQAQGKSYNEIQALKKQMVLDIYGGFPKTPEDRTQARNLEKRFDTLRIRGTADARVDALVVAQSNEEKTALLREYEKSMSVEEYADLKRFIIKNRVVSSAVFQALNRVE
jgi:hypothetical protein